MSQTNVESFKRAVEALNGGDVEGLLKELDAEVEWHAAVQELLGSGAGGYHGHEGVREWWRDINDALAELEFEYSEIRDLGDRILGSGRFIARGRTSGIEIESPIASLLDYRNGKAVRMLGYLDPDEALEAAELQE